MSRGKKKTTWAKTGRISVRLTPNQEQVLEELRVALGTTYSVLLRSIVLDFLTRNEEELERIITSKQVNNELFTEERPEGKGVWDESMEEGETKPLDDAPTV